LAKIQPGSSESARLATVDYTILTWGLFEFFNGLPPGKSENSTVFTAVRNGHSDGGIIKVLDNTFNRKICNVGGICQFQYGSSGGNARQRFQNFAVPTLNSDFQPTVLVRTLIGVGLPGGGRGVQRIIANNQYEVPATATWTFHTITLPAGAPFSITDVLTWGTPAYDAVDNMNYICAQLLPAASQPIKSWFCKMDNNYNIVHLQPVGINDFMSERLDHHILAL
jgi:hypothetical protein